MPGIGHNSGAAELLREIDVFAELQQAIRQAGGQKAWAAAHGVSPQNLSDVLNARREISPAILAALGLRKVARYSRVSISAPRVAA